MPRAVAVNIGANTNEPGFRGPVYPDGSFAYVPIPESAATCSRASFPVDEPLPTYADLELPFTVPPALTETPVHMDPEFPDVHGRSHATYGDPYGVKAGPIGTLDPGDWLLFYATLSLRPHDWIGPTADTESDTDLHTDSDTEADTDSDADSDTEADTGRIESGFEGFDPGIVNPDIAPEWGAYLIAGMQIQWLESDPNRGDAIMNVPTNAHCKRDPFDARVVVAGDPDQSGCFERVVPLSDPTAGATANEIVTELSSDSGRGPWWRRPMRFDADATATLLARVQWP